MQELSQTVPKLNFLHPNNIHRTHPHRYLLLGERTVGVVGVREVEKLMASNCKNYGYFPSSSISHKKETTNVMVSLNPAWTSACVISIALPPSCFIFSGQMWQIFALILFAAGYYYKEYEQSSAPPKNCIWSWLLLSTVSAFLLSTLFKKPLLIYCLLFWLCSFPYFDFMLCGFAFYSLTLFV